MAAKFPTLLLVALLSALVGAVTVWLLRAPTPQSIVINIEDGAQSRIISTGKGSRGPTQFSRPMSSPAALDAASPQTVLGDFADTTEDLPSPSPITHTVSMLSPRVKRPLLLTDPPRNRIDEALSYALEAAMPHVKEGFTLREDYWGGDLPVRDQKAIIHQLFKGNEYWFWMGTDVADATIAVHIYDAEGNLAEAEAQQDSHFAVARVEPKQTGSYYLIVEVENSPEERTPWALAYGFR